jgi:hypothetical protein
MAARHLHTEANALRQDQQIRCDSHLGTVAQPQRPTGSFGMQSLSLRFEGASFKCNQEVDCHEWRANVVWLAFAAQGHLA